MTVGEALRALEAREARLLLARATGFSEASVLAHPERPLSAEAQRRFIDFAQRRARGEPIAYILGEKEFYGLPLGVNPAVLIPRPETELLVELALARKPSTVLDLGTGCGAIALAIKRHLPSSAVDAANLIQLQEFSVRPGPDREAFARSLPGSWMDDDRRPLGWTRLRREGDARFSGHLRRIQFAAGS